MSISRLAAAIAESPTMKLNEEATALRARNEPVIHLGIGEPKNKAPQAAIDSGIARLKTGLVKYTPASGIPPLKEAIIQYTEVNYGRSVSPKNVIVTAGAKQAIFNALYALLDEQDEVILLAPYWVSYPEMVKMLRGVPVIVTPEDGSFHPTMADIERAVTPRTKAIIVNSPNNPSGVVLSEVFIAALVDFCETRGIYALMDDIYHKLVFDGVRAPSCFAFTAHDIESTKLIVINGVAKTYGMTGFRIGWAVASQAIVKVMANVQSQTTSCNSDVLQAAAEAALTGPQDEVEHLRLFMQKNRDVVLHELAKIPGVKTVKPEGTFYCLPDFRAHLGGAIARNSLELAGFLLKKALVVTVPGFDFGVEGHLRLSYAGSTEDAAEGVTRIRWALDPSAPREIRLGDQTAVRDWL
jgi:aspartate aminotransferase